MFYFEGFGGMKADRLIEMWGWSNPPPSVVEAADHVTKAKGRDIATSAEILGICDSSRVKSQLTGRRSVAAEEWSEVTYLVEKIPEFKRNVDFYKTVSAGKLYLATLKGHANSELMALPDVRRRCDEISAILITTDNNKAVVVFSSYDSMRSYESLGKAEKSKCPIYIALDCEQPVLAVSSHDEVVERINSAADASSGGDGGYVWRPANSKNDVDRKISRFIDYALESRATDISITPRENRSLNVLVRINTVLVEPKIGSAIEASLAEEVLRRLLAKSGASDNGVTIPTVPVDGQITYESPKGKAFLRLSFIPLNHAGDESRTKQSISIRVLPVSEQSVDIKKLSIPDAVVRDLNYAMSLGSGLILITGPTNSGKSTTVDAAVTSHIEQYGDAVKRIGIYDPIERYIKGMSAQIRVNHRAVDSKSSNSNPYETNLRAILRHDPDMIYVAEIRDADTAELTVKAANTGHLVLSTLHANSCRSAVERLANLVDENAKFQLAEAVALVVSQRLLPILCQHCRVESEVGAEERWQLENFLKQRGKVAAIPLRHCKARHGGCEKCSNGYAGLIPVFEVLPVTNEVREAFVALVNGDAVFIPSAENAPVNVRKYIDDRLTANFIDSTIPLLAEGVIELHSVMK